MMAGQEGRVGQAVTTAEKYVNFGTRLTRISRIPANQIAAMMEPFHGPGNAPGRLVRTVIHRQLAGVTLEWMLFALRDNALCLH